MEGDTLPNEEERRRRWEQYLEERRRKLRSHTHVEQPSDSCCRAPREDDDGYDPYSDRQEVPRLFEKNPWD